MKSIGKEFMEQILERQERERYLRELAQDTYEELTQQKAERVELERLRTNARHAERQRQRREQYFHPRWEAAPQTKEPQLSTKQKVGLTVGAGLAGLAWGLRHDPNKRWSVFKK